MADDWEPVSKVKDDWQPVSQSWGATAADAAKSFGRGVVRGAEEMVGSLGDIREAAKKIPFGGTALSAVPIVGTLAKVAPTTEQVTKGVESATGGPLEAPKTHTGQYAQSIGEYVPSMVVGPEGALPKTLMTIFGGAGAQLGEDLFGPKGRFFGGFLGGVTGGAAAAETAERRLARALPDDAANKKASQAAFKMVQQAGVKISPVATRDFINNLESKTLHHAFITRAGAASEIFPQLDRAKQGDLAELIDLHSRLGKIKPRRGELYEAAVLARPEIREFIENLQRPDLIAGDPRFASQVWSHARDTWRIHAKLSEVRQAAEAADVRRLATGRGMNWNTFRQEFKKIVLSDDKTRGYSDEAVAKMEQIVKGTLLQNSARIGSAMAPQRGVLGAAPTAFALATGGLEPAGIVATIGELSHFLEGYLTKRQIKQLEDLIKRESPIAPKQTRPDWQAIAPAAAARAALTSHDVQQYLDGQK